MSNDKLHFEGNISGNVSGFSGNDIIFLETALIFPEKCVKYNIEIR